MRSSVASSSSSAALVVALMLACGGGHDPGDAGASVRVDVPPAVPRQPAAPPIDDCAALASAAADDEDDAALLPVLCPDTPLDAVTARAVLMAAGTSAQAGAAAPSLASFPELHAMAQLVGHIAAPIPANATLVDPATAGVTPIDTAVLGQAQLARVLLYDDKTPVDTRTRARAYLAKVHMGALKQLGVGPARPPGPFARLLAAHAIHYGRSFCTSFWRRRVSGLFELFAQTEVDLLQATLALEASHPGGDPGIVAVELQQGRQYLRRDATAARVKARLVGSVTATAVHPDRLAPVVNELDRLVAAGFVDLALGSAVSLGARAGGPGLAPMEQLLTDDLRRAEADEYLDRLAKRFARARKREPKPAETGPGELEHAREVTWPSATVQADRMLAAVAEAPAAGFARRRALGRAVLAARRRPDALLAAIDQAQHGDANVRAALPLLRAVADELDDGNLRYLRRASPAELDREVRQRFARTDREAGGQPR